MKEIKSLRKRNEKHFLNPDGTITAYLYNNDIHYLKNGEYEEIDNTIMEDKDSLYNKKNAFQTYFLKDTNDNLIVDIKHDNHYLKMFLKDNKSPNLKVIRNKEQVSFKDILEDIDFNYDVIATKLKESIILKNKNNIPENLSFIIETDLELVLNNKRIEAKKDNKSLFTIDSPYMFDSNNNYNYNINYDLKKENSTYLLTLNLDLDWLRKEDTTYPVIIDPTILESNIIVYDTYIYPGDTNINRNNTDKLKVGVDSNNTVYRSLIKFDLPTIGTGCDIISARAYLSSHSSDYVNDVDTRGLEPVEVHAINGYWTEESASWNNIYNMYEDKVEDFIYPNRTKRTIYSDYYDEEIKHTYTDITNLVKRWYAGYPNNGIMLKAHNEVYNKNCKEYTFYSANNTVTNIDNPKPVLVITYRNQNGLEDYMSYKTQTYTDGTSYINNLTGNLTTVFNLNETIGGKYPISLSMIYNTNDMVLNNDYGYKPGYKLSLHETIKEVKIDNKDYLEYLDGDGTIHYFVHDNDDEGNLVTSEYVDEDGLGLSATYEFLKYTVKDKNNNNYIFKKHNNDIYYLEELINTNGDIVYISYDNNDRISAIIDANNSMISLAYNSDSIEFISDSKTTKINYTNDLITSLETNNGITLFTYNDNKLIEKITDVTGLSNEFSYYNVNPYRIKKVTEYGLNNKLGSSLSFEYGFLTTRVIDDKGRYNTYTFNTRGNTIGITNLDSETNLSNAYGKGIIYENDTIYNDNNTTKLNKAVNNISNEILPVKYTKNLINNSSFEDDPELDNITNEEARTGEYSYKINGYDYLVLEAEDDKTYTFSGYFKNDEEIGIEITTPDLNSPEILAFGKIPANKEFTRYSFTFSLGKGKNEIDINISGNAYLDDIQLEEGEIANYYNLLDNGDFSNGLDGWTLNGNSNDTLITLSNGMKALRFKPEINKYKSLSKTIKLKGYKTTEERGIGDVYYLSFWYKNTTLEKESGLMMGGFGTSVLVNFLYPDDYLYPGCALPYSVIPSNEEWQFFSAPFYSDSSSDYENLYLTIFASDNVNEFLITNISLTKDIEQNYSLFNSTNGNLESTRNMDNTSSEFKYDKNNQLTSMFNPKGNNFSFEYDNTITDRVLKGISPTGISNEIEYDNIGNPIKTIINNINPSNDIIDNNNYQIRLKGTNKYFDCNFLNKTVSLKSDDCSHDAFKLIKNGDFYYLEIANLYLSLSNNNLILTSNKNEDSLFKLTKNTNGSYLITPKANYDKSNLNVCYDNDELIIKNIDQDDNKAEFYFEDINTNLFIESKAEYTSDGKFITKVVDSLNKETNYDVDSIKGLTNSITDPNNNITYYTYNDKDQVTKVSKNNKDVEYIYNTQNLLDNIKSGNKTYNFIYDEFLNTKQVKINDNILVTNTYEANNGNLAKTTYGNNDTIAYTYDELDRLKTITTSDNTYTNIYDNVGNLSKIKSNTDTYNYYYDLSNRLSRYITSNFKIDYDYDTNNNVIKKNYKLVDDHIINYEYNKDDAITKISFDNDNLNYTYDYLGRLISKDLNNKQKIEYTYITNGNKTSTVIDTMK
ncbi:MAG: DNRLRE domain-containing protein, partial [Ruminococcus sp.]|nr:DNRLRE domain-containing protein [Ruminococcus sp.]